MTLTFPLSLADFALKLTIKHFDWRLEAQQDIAGMASGAPLVEDVAPSIWRSPVVLDSMTHEEAAQAQALIESLDGARGRFYFHDPRRAYPLFDKTGSIIGANVVRIAELHSNNKWLKLKGLTAGYKISRGDWFHRDYSSNPVHRGYYRVSSEEVIADAFGNTGWIEFRQHFLPGSAAVNDVITIKQAAAMCLIQPRSFNPGQSAGTRNTGMSFEIRQVL